MDANSFFSLEAYAHKALWLEGEPVWMALKRLKDYFKPGCIEVDLEGVHVKNREWISIGEGTVIEPGVMIVGPCIIGKRCQIRHGAYLREHVICGDDCQIGHSAELKHSILLDGASATHFVYVGDSILGNGVNLGAGVKCANLRLDRREVAVAGVKTGLKKLGAIVGDRVQIGCNSVLNPGTLIGKESFAYPLTSVSGLIPPRSQVSQSGVAPIEQKILERLLWTPIGKG